MMVSIVLVVEDNAIVRLGAVETLRELGCTVYEAGSADEAMHILHERDGVGVLFTDIEMPGTISGLELARYVGRKWPATFIVISSGRTLPPKSDLPSGARFLAKPYYSHDLADIAKLTGIEWPPNEKHRFP